MEDISYTKKLEQLIPGGAHTYSRGVDQFPLNAPQIFEFGKGAYAYEPNGNKFLDYGMALRSITIGYGNEEIAEAAYKDILKGNSFTRPSLTELEAAELFVSLIPSAEMVKFAKNGSNVTSAAVKLARAFNKKNYVGICAQNPFFTFDDWFIGTTQIQRGIPEEHHKLGKKFDYNNIDSLNKLYDDVNGDLSCIILEPATTLSPCSINCNRNVFREKNCSLCENNKNNFLHKVRQFCDEKQVILIFDEIITGFRWHLNGAQTYFGVTPDLSTFGKAMANGMSVSALCGKKEIMDLGGINKEGLERTFLLSSTYGAEMSSLAAFKKTIEIYKRDNVINHLWNYGAKLIDGANNISQSLGILDYFYFEGYPCSPNYITLDKDKNISLDLRTLFSQEMIKNGILMPWVSLSLSHTDADLEFTLNTLEKVLKIYKMALENGTNTFLEGRAIKPVFRKHN